MQRCLCVCRSMKDSHGPPKCIRIGSICGQSGNENGAINEFISSEEEPVMQWLRGRESSRPDQRAPRKVSILQFSNCSGNLIENMSKWKQISYLFEGIIIMTCVRNRRCNNSFGLCRLLKFDEGSNTTKCQVACLWIRFLFH